MALLAPAPQVCHRCTRSVPKHARTCPNCLVPLGEITVESVLGNILLVILALGLLVAAGWGVYHFLLLGE